MAIGAWRISLARVLTRRAAAIETLGSATVLCTDNQHPDRKPDDDRRVAAEGWERLPPQNDMEMPAQFQDFDEFGLLRESRLSSSTRWSAPSMAWRVSG